MKLQPKIANDWRRHDEGVRYAGHITHLEDGSSDYGPYVKAEIAGEVEDGTSMLLSVNKDGIITKRSKLGKTVAILFPDFDFAGDETFDTDDLLGQPVVVTFEHIPQDDGGWKEKATIVSRGKGEALKIEDPTAPF